MRSERVPQPRWLKRRGVGVVRSAFAGLLAAAVLIALLPSANAQTYDRRTRPAGDFFNPFRLFTPLFQPPPQRPQRELRQQRAPQPSREFRAPSQPVSADASKAPPPRKSDTTPTQSVVVFGSSLADWLAYGLEEAYADRPELGIVRKVHSYSGLVRFDSRGNTDWAQYIRDTLKEQNADVVVMLIGLLDRQPIRTQQVADDPSKRDKSAVAAPEPKRGGGPYEFRTDEWAAAYSARIDQAIAAMKTKGVPVIWVGLPAIRGTKSTSDMIYLNDLFRTRAEHAGIVYVDVWDGFVDESGHYSNFGPDVEGQVRRLRTAEGVYFTKAGAGKLAHYVEREINRLIGTKLPQVATPTPTGDDAGGTIASRPDATAVPTRPVAGPVLSLTGSESANALAGADVRQGVSDPLAQRVLVKGEAVVGPTGRADNFFLTPEAASAAAAASAAVPPATIAAPKPAASSAKPATPAANVTPAARPNAAPVGRQEAARESPRSSAPKLDGATPPVPDIAAHEPLGPPLRSPPVASRPIERRAPAPRAAVPQTRAAAPPPRQTVPPRQAVPPRQTVQKPRPNNRPDPRTAARRPPPNRPPAFDPLGLFR